MFQAIDILNASLELEEFVLAQVDAIRGLDFARRYVDGAIRLNDTVIHYETIRRRQLNRMLSTLSDLDESTELSHVLDYGCGKGYLLHLLAESRCFEEIRGIEILPELCEIAHENLLTLGHNSVTVECADARQYENVDDIDTFLMFNPFPAEAMAEVADQIRASIERRDRVACIIYINNAQDLVLREHLRCFSLVAKKHNLPRYGCDSVIYIHRPESTAAQ